MSARTHVLSALVLAAACAATAAWGQHPGVAPSGSQPARPQPAARVPPGAPPQPTASWVLEPPRIRIGDVAALELVVVTPPDHRVRPVAPPADVKGFWLLGSEALPVEREPTRWVHRTRLRIRARELGVFLWPAVQVAVDGPDGARAVLDVPGHTLEVASVLPEHAGRSTPFGLRAPGELARGASPLGPALVGAALALSAVGLVLLVRRERARRRGLTETAAAAGPDPDRAAYDDALAALGAAATDTDVRRAADTAARALKRYAARRFGASSFAATTPELRAGSPPFAMRSRWPAFVALLEALDARRFPPDPNEAAAELRARIDESVAFVHESAPDERLQ